MQNRIEAEAGGVTGRDREDAEPDEFFFRSHADRVPQGHEALRKGLGGGLVWLVALLVERRASAGRE